MPLAEFEEKAFEGPLNSQLRAGGTIYTPGQVLESAVGFDAAMETYHSDFWKLWGGPPARGAVPQADWWPAVPSTSELPPFRLNVFLQYKRPRRLMMSHASQWSYWKKPYFRFPIDHDQQQLLDLCAQGLGTRGLVLYACPAFYKWVDLFEYTVKNTIVTNTNFVEATKLQGHSSYTFVDVGVLGMAFSTPTPVKPVKLYERLDSMFQLMPEKQEDRVFEAADRAVSEVVELYQRTIWRPEALDGLLDRFASEVTDDPAPLNAIRQFMRVGAFCNLTGLGWLIAAGAERGADGSTEL